MQQIQMYYTRFSQALPSKQFETYLHTLPADLQQKVQRFIRWQDQHASLFARLLLKQALQVYGYDLDAMQYTAAHQRPFINDTIDFNIAHSGEYVLCVISCDGQLGIDIEQVRAIETEHFTTIFTPAQWKIISQNVDLYPFFKFWTQKESVIKADGRGLSVELDQIEAVHNQVALQDKTWFLHEIDDFLPDYASHLATAQQDISIQYLPQYFD